MREGRFHEADPMNCPSCDGELDADMVYGEPAAACASCGGIWLAAGALDNIARAPLEQKLREEWACEPDSCRSCRSALGFDHRCPTCGKPPKIACPRGHGVMKTAWVQLAGTDAEVDQCSSCGGLWIDAHERKLLHGAALPKPIKLDAVVPPPPRSRFMWSRGPASHEPKREIDKFLAAASGMHVGMHGWSPPSMNAARVMLVVAAIMFIVFKFFAWPFVQGMLD